MGHLYWGEELRPERLEEHRLARRHGRPAGPVDRTRRDCYAAPRATFFSGFSPARRDGFRSAPPENR
jgi:hypothetical protein